MKAYFQNNKDRLQEKGLVRMRDWRSVEENLQKERERARDNYDRYKETRSNYRKTRSEHSPLYRSLVSTKARAKRKKIPFDLTLDDLPVPTHCPVLGIELKYGPGPLVDGSVSLDKFIPELGYVRGNVRVISNRANTLKNNMTLAEWEALGKYLRGEV